MGGGGQRERWRVDGERESKYYISCLISIIY